MDFKFSEPIQFKEINPDTEIIEQNNKEWKALERNLIDLKDSMNFIKEYVTISNTQIIEIENNVTKTNNQLDVTLDNLTKVNVIKQNNNNNIQIIKVITGAIICGTLFGGIGACFGLIPAIGSTSIGLGTGGLIGKFI